MYNIRPSSKFEKDVRRLKKRGYDMSLLTKVLTILAQGKALPAEYKDHRLKGKYASCHECHITPDWLLVYEISQRDLMLYLTRTGTHSDLF